MVSWCKHFVRILSYPHPVVSASCLCPPGAGSGDGAGAGSRADRVGDEQGGEGEFDSGCDIL
ncbi:MAG: hypothetical protein IJU95_08490 [Treponema sp.]|nr:hypothetical protein [Treponema sp.]